MSLCRALFVELLPITIRSSGPGEVALQISVPPRGVEWKRKTAKTDINNER